MPGCVQVSNTARQYMPGCVQVSNTARQYMPGCVHICVLICLLWKSYSRHNQLY